MAGQKNINDLCGEYYITLVLIVGTPLIYWRGLRQMFALPKFGFFYFLLITMCGIVIIKYLSSSTLIIYGNRKVLLLLIAAILLALAAYAFSIHRHISLFGTYGRYEGLVTMIGYLITFFIVSQIDWTKRNRLSYFVITFITTATLSSLVGILEMIGFPVISGSNIDISQTAARSSSTFGNPVFLGIYLAMSLPVIFMEIITAKSKKTIKIVALYISFLLVSSILLFSSTRSALLGVFIGVIVIILLSPPKIRRLVLINFLIFNIIITGFIIFTLHSSGTANISNRIASILKFGGENSARVEMWKIGGRMIIDRPIFGSGPDTTGLLFPKYITKKYLKASGGISVENNIHNYLLELGITMGLPFAAILIILIAFIINNWIKKQPRQLSGDYLNASSESINLKNAPCADIREFGLVGALAAYLVGTSLNPNTLEIGIVFWVMLGIVSSVITFKSSKHAIAVNWAEKSMLYRQLLIGLVIIMLILLILPMSIILAADNQFISGSNFLRAGLYDQAFHAFQKAAELNPYVNEYWEYQEKVLIELRHKRHPRVNQEINILKRAISFNSYQWSNYIRLANAYFIAAVNSNKSRYLKEAEKTLQKATALKPLSPISSYFQSFIFVERSQIKQAKQALSHSLELDPSYKPALDLQKKLNSYNK